MNAGHRDDVSCGPPGRALLTADPARVAGPDGARAAIRSMDTHVMCLLPRGPAG